VRVVVNATDYMVVCPTGELDDSAILRRSADSKWTCTTCEQNKTKCLHMSRTDGEWNAARVSREVLEARLAKFLDEDAGCRRLTCLSAAPVPEIIAQSEQAEQYVGMLPALKVCACMLSN
jgi:hypothetical protein